LVKPTKGIRKEEKKKIKVFLPPVPKRKKQREEGRSDPGNCQPKGGERKGTNEGEGGREGISFALIYYGEKKGGEIILLPNAAIGIDEEGRK